MASLHPSRRSSGFSLIEVMVSLLISLLLILAIASAFLAGRMSYRVMDVSSRIQETARYAFENLSYDIRMAGSAGCGHASEANVLNNSNDWDKDLFNFPLAGFEEGVSAYPAALAGNVLRGDALTVLRADNLREYIIASHNAPAAQLQLTANHDIKQGEILVATNCSHAAVFQMTNVNNNNTIDTVVHNTGAATTPGNCTKGLGAPADCSDPLGTSYAFAPGSRLLRLNSIAYYLRQSASGEPALYRQRLAHSGGNAASVAEELAEGVENMQILYGVDTSASADGAVDAYVTADQVTGVAPGGSDSEKWKRVLSVRVSLLMVSPGNENITTKPQRYTFNGVTTTPNDRRLRKVLDYTIALRNRL
jgi:type IV pilus assembly protein PilW